MKILTNASYKKLREDTVNNIRTEIEEDMRKLKERNLTLNSSLSNSISEVYRIQGNIKELNLKNGFINFLVNKFNINKDEEYHEYMLNDVIGIKTGEQIKQQASKIK